EGTSAMQVPPFMLPAVYYALQGHGVGIAFDAVSPAPAYLGVAAQAADYYTPSYDYVVTPFMDVRTGRSVIGRFGPFVLERRAPLDPVLSSSTWSLPRAGKRVPSFGTPFDVRIASDRTTNAALMLRLGTRAEWATVALARGGRTLPTRVGAGG